MPYNPAIADSLRAALAPQLAAHEIINEQRMFGGLAFLMHGHMCCGVIEDKIVLRINPASLDQVMGMPGVGPMDFTGRPMKGWLYLRPPASTIDLPQHLSFALSHVRALPPKPSR
jgi:TfoX/Sxy family transcriptional regulator of competence genes